MLNWFTIDKNEGMLNWSIHHWPSVTFSENNKGARPWQKIRAKLSIFYKEWNPDIFRMFLKNTFLDRIW